MRSRATVARQLLFPTTGSTLVLLMALVGCFRDPDASKLICQTVDQCPTGYWCTAANKCERGQLPVDASGGASVDLRSSDTSNEGTDAAAGEVSSIPADASITLTDAFDGRPAGDLGVDAGPGTDGAPGALDAAATTEAGGAAAPIVRTFTATPTSIATGQTSTLSWTVSGATLISLDQGIGVVGASGSEIVSPTQTTNYTLTAQNAAGDSVTAKAVVTVAAAPSIQSLTATPSTISVGSSATVTATFTNAVNATIDKGIGIVVSGVGVSIGPLTASTTYTLTATNSVGTQVSQQVTVTVVPLPIITSFTGAAGAVYIGSSTTLTAVFADGVGSIDHGIGTVTSGTAVSTGKLTASTRFTLTVTNAAGDAVTKQLTVTGLGLGPTGSLSVARAGHSATLLLDGTVLIAGGQNEHGAVLDAEIYDPATGAFAATKGQLLVSCGAASAALLADGTVLLACPNSNSRAQIYDPSSQGFTATTGPMLVMRVGATATTLAGGKVLIVGGTVDSSAVATAELYDPNSGTFSSAGSMTEKRSGHTSTFLSNGKVLIAGGFSPVSGGGPLLQDAEIYDPTSGTFGSPPIQMIAPRILHTATLLENGTVVLVGGSSDALSSIDSVELFDPTGGSFKSDGTMVVQRASHAAVRLTNGNVFVSGGFSGSGRTGALLDELFDPSGVPMRTGPAATIGRVGHTATLLSNGQVLLVGGSDGTSYLLSADLYAY